LHPFSGEINVSWRCQAYLYPSVYYEVEVGYLRVIEEEARHSPLVIGRRRV
jgi:hypothetical protein